jgi:hypothetical protein
MIGDRTTTANREVVFRPILNRDHPLRNSPARTCAAKAAECEREGAKSAKEDAKKKDKKTMRGSRSPGFFFASSFIDIPRFLVFLTRFFTAETQRRGEEERFVHECARIRNRIEFLLLFVFIRVPSWINFFSAVQILFLLRPSRAERSSRLRKAI